MLRACFSQGPAAAAASSSARAQLHTSSVLHAESQRKRRARLTRQSNLTKRAEIQQEASSQRPHVVLGTVPGKEDKWTTSDLARVLVRPDELAPPSDPEVVRLPAGDITLPRTLNYGIGAPEKALLFAHLPLLSADMSSARWTADAIDAHDATRLAQWHGERFAEAVRQANALAKVLDLRNANAQGIAYENRRRVIAEFSEPGKPNDTGRPEVQAAILTLQIRNLWDHLSKFKRDVGNRRSLRKLVHQRAKILRYLKGVDRDRYDTVLVRLGLEPGSVEGELVV